MLGDVGGLNWPIAVKLGFDARDFKSGQKEVQRAIDDMRRTSKGAETDLKQGLKRALEDVGHTGTKQFQALTEGVKTAHAAIVALAGSALVGLGVKLSHAGEIAEEVESKFGVVFKGQAEQMRAFTDELAVGLGRSRVGMAGLAADSQAALIALGYTRDVGAEMSKTLVRLAVDLAAFHGEAESDALRALTQAIGGSELALRKYGIVISTAKLDQELLRLGMRSVKDGANEQQQAVARLSVILAAQGDALGEVARSTESFSNTVKGAKGGFFDEFAAQGERLNKALVESAHRMGGARNAGETLAIAIRPLTTLLEQLVRVLNAAADALGGWEAILKLVRFAALALDVVIRTIATGIMVLLAPLRALVAGIRLLIETGYDASDMKKDLGAALDDVTKSALANDAAMQNLIREFNGGGAAADDARKKFAALDQSLVDSLTSKFGSDLRGNVRLFIQAGIEATESFKAEAEKRTKALGDELRAQEDTLKKAVARLAALDQGRAANKESVVERIFGLSLDAAQDPAAKIDLLLQRIRQLNTEAAGLQGGGQFEAARGKLANVSAMIEEIAKLEGFANLAQRQAELATIAQRIDALFEQEIAQQEKVRKSAEDSVSALRAQLETIAAQSAFAETALKTYKSELETLDAQPLEALATKWKALAGEIEIATIKAAAFKAAQEAIGMVKGAESGNNIPGTGKAMGGDAGSWRAPGSTDTIPAMLAPGEFVVNAKQTRKHARLLRAINAGGVQGFESGGFSDFRDKTRYLSSIIPGLEQKDRELRDFAAAIRDARKNPTWFKASQLRHGAGFIDTPQSDRRYELTNAIFGNAQSQSAASAAARAQYRSYVGAGYLNRAGDVQQGFIPGFEAGGFAGRGAGRSMVVKVGDVNVTIQGGGSARADGVAVGREVKKAISRGLFQF